MKLVYILCEGQTEESFVNELMYSSFFEKGIVLIPIICHTKREPSGIKHKGGGATYGKIHNELIKLCRSKKSSTVTMLFDYYALPHDTPGMDTLPIGSSLDKILHLEDHIGQDIAAENFIPNIVMHEFEGLLFSEPEAFSYCGLSQVDIHTLQNIRNTFTTPEDINDGLETAPSKRILDIHPSYSKVRDGINIARDIGLYTISSECKHFNGWLARLSQKG